MPLFGSNRSSTTSNTTNITETTTTMRDVGLTGGAAVGIVEALSQAQVGLAREYSNVALGVTGRAIGESMSLSRLAADRTLDTIASVSRETLGTVREAVAGINNASRDFAQRSIAASTGQSTPIQTLTPAGGSGIPGWVWIAGAVAALFFLKG